MGPMIIRIRLGSDRCTSLSLHFDLETRLECFLCCEPSFLLSFAPVLWDTMKSPSKPLGRPASTRSRSKDRHRRSRTPSRPSASRVVKPCSPSSSSFFNVGMFLCLYVAASTSLPIYAHYAAHGLLNPSQILLSFFLSLNFLIALWEIALGTSKRIFILSTHYNSTHYKLLSLVHRTAYIEDRKRARGVEWEIQDKPRTFHCCDWFLPTSTRVEWMLFFVLLDQSLEHLQPVWSIIFEQVSHNNEVSTLLSLDVPIF